MPESARSPGRQRTNARARAAQLRQPQQRREQQRKLLLVSGISAIVIAVVVAMVLVFVLRSDKQNTTSTAIRPAPTSVVNAVTKVPEPIVQAVGQEIFDSPEQD
jgi:hypothetical protein